MRNIFYCICLLLVLSISVLGQVSKDNPLGGQIIETFSSEESKAFIDVELLREDDANLSIPVTNINNVTMTLLSVTVKLPNGKTEAKPINKLVLCNQSV